MKWDSIKTFSFPNLLTSYLLLFIPLLFLLSCKRGLGPEAIWQEVLYGKR